MHQKGVNMYYRYCPVRTASLHVEQRPPVVAADW
jgi:hypothetical protein